jgi:hypothetical protein
MQLETERYLDQNARWPASGQHILASYDDETIVVYQAYNDGIGRWAAANQRFGNGFSFERMTWIKPNFLWMMFRSGWATKPDQTAVLAIRMLRSGFDALLAEAVRSSVKLSASEQCDVRVQWDPDHGPSGEKLERRAIQLGLRGAALERYCDEWIVGIEDITAFVREQHGQPKDLLITPRERVYPTVSVI